MPTHDGINDMTDQSTADTDVFSDEGGFSGCDGSSDDVSIDADDGRSGELLASETIEYEETEYVSLDVAEVPPELDQRTGPVARYDERHNVLWIGSMPIPFRVGESRNGELIELLGASIRQLRGLDDQAPCPLRRSEYRLLAELLDLSDPELRHDLRRHLGITRRQAGDTVTELRRVLDDQQIHLD